MRAAADPAFAPATRLVFREQVLDRLRAAIAGGQLRMGEPIREREIAERMQISRAPIREALRDLEKEGLVVTLPHRGACVAVYTDADVEEIYSLRAALEALAIERAIVRATPEDVRALEQSVDAMEQLVGIGDFDAILRADTAFHRRICAVASHRRLLDTWESLARQIQAIYTVTDLPKLVQQLYGYMANIGDRHRPIVDAIRTGDVPFGRRYITAHILQVAQILAAQRAAARAKDGAPDRSAR
jgi:DNA-binding GntR family transcriptional regulator